MASIFTIVDEYQLLLNQIEELDGEITPELEAQLIIHEDEVANKVRAYHKVILIANSQIELTKEEQERLGAVRKTKENLIKRIKQYVNLAVETFGTIKPKAVGKSLDLGDLKVWQKKTEALDIIGEIDDERFCDKQVVFNFRYSQYEEFMKLIEGTTFADDPHITIIPDKSAIKDWLIENEEEHKTMIEEIKNRPSNVQFMVSSEIKHTEEELKIITQRINDLKVLSATDLKHNSTVVFK